MFGSMAIAKFAPISEHFCLKDFENIDRYVDRIKSEVYPDWDEVIKGFKA